mmetsp:Transcript_102/g.248  ORF Transcript_102/g.248 Transcript_102/m.248 type:complete len:305 (-) Transcript_102:1073-1987(-)
MATYNVTVAPEDRRRLETHDPLRTEDPDPLPLEESFNRARTQVYESLVNHHNRSGTLGYLQSHPVSQLYTSHDLAKDQWTLSNNYMRVIFGGDVNDSEDNIHLAYNHAIRDRAEAPTLREKTLYELNPSDFVPGEESPKDALLKTFEEQRRYYKGAIDDDTERALKQRPTHRTTHTTFYGKQVTQQGSSARFHLLAGQHGHLQYRPDTSNFTPQANLSSRTYAPTEDGREVPLYFALERDADPRAALGDAKAVRYFSDPGSGVFNNNDVGSFGGAEIDQYKASFREENPGLESLFRESAQRRYA